MVGIHGCFEKGHLKILKGDKIMTNKRWHINYKGWRITHDPLGKLACYWIEGGTLNWCYFGNSINSIKAEIDRREFLHGLNRMED